MKNVSDNVIRKTTENINTNEVDILPINTGIIIQFYDDNPYRVLETSKSGIIQGIETSKKHFSNETGEIEKDKVMTMSTVLVDTEGKSYATGSKVFGIQIMQYLQMFANKNGFEPFEIEIIKKSIKGSSNKALGFELV